MFEDGPDSNLQKHFGNVGDAEQLAKIYKVYQLGDGGLVRIDFHDPQDVDQAVRNIIRDTTNQRKEKTVNFVLQDSMRTKGWVQGVSNEVVVCKSANEGLPFLTFSPDMMLDNDSPCIYLW